MIYVGKSESQGLALHEAWMADVPTLVYNPKKWQTVSEGKSYSWNDDSIAAPYLVEDTGMFWNDSDDFEQKWDEFISKLGKMKPREYSLKHFSDIISLQNLIGIIDEHGKK